MAGEVGFLLDGSRVWGVSERVPHCGNLPVLLGKLDLEHDL
jgi:hypothetical protein